MKVETRAIQQQDGRYLSVRVRKARGPFVLLSFIFFARRDDSVQPARCQGAQPTGACLIQKLNAES
jgi:hypothetical protein